MTLISLRHKALVQNVLALYGVQAFGYLLPLLTIPYLARMLGAEGWGIYAFFQSFALYVSGVSEYGFSLWGTREVARYQGDKVKRGKLLTAVNGAKLLLLGGVCIITVILLLTVPMFQQYPLVVGSSFLWGASLVLSQFWYYQGIERIKFAAGVEVGTKAIATILLFILVTKQSDVWLAFLLFAAANAISIGWTLWVVRDDITIWNLPESVAVLRDAFTLFQTRIAYSLYSAGNVFLFGLIATPVTVGFYAGADKIVKASMSALFEPITRGIFPRVSSLLKIDSAKAAKLVRLGLAAELSTGILLSLVLYFGAPYLVPIILGDGFESTIPLLRLLALLPPIVSISTVLGHHWMLAHGMDRAFSVAIWCAAGVTITGLLLLVPLWGAKGMVISSITADSTLSLIVIVSVLRKGLFKKLFQKAPQ